MPAPKPINATIFNRNVQSHAVDLIRTKTTDLWKVICKRKVANPSQKLVSISIGEGKMYAELKFKW